MSEVATKEDFFADVTRNGQPLTMQEKIEFLEKLNAKLLTSSELAKIHFNTQVYNVIENSVTTRGGHSEGVANTAQVLAETFVGRNSESADRADEIKLAGLLSKALGYMHDLGHTPFGHDGEGALDDELSRFKADQGYKDKREKLFGADYVAEETAKEMCYEHNETSSIIGSRILEEFAASEGVTLGKEAKQYIITGILAHSTSRVKTEPKGIEQRAVRLADKVAYIPQDLLDLLKQSVISIDDLTEQERGLLGLSVEQFSVDDQEKLAYFSKEEIIEEKEKLIQGLRDLKNSTKEKKDELFAELDGLVKGMQREIAVKCIQPDDKGDFDFAGKKDRVDIYDKAVNKGKNPEKGLNGVEPLGEKVFRGMREAQKRLKGVKDPEVYKTVMQGEKEFKYDEESKMFNIDGQQYDFKSLKPLLEDEKKRAEIVNAIGVNGFSEMYKQFLIQEEKIDPFIAGMWVTKAKYQDSFIAGELSRESGEQSRETLGDINNRNEMGWRMKTTFQYFYTHQDALPKEIQDKYPLSEFTEQQRVSAFIASFTNVGLSDLYDGLLKQGVILSREAVIDAVKKARPDVDIESFVSGTEKFSREESSNPNRKEEEVKVSANDKLEILYREAFGEPIIPGTSLDAIPDHPETDAIIKFSKRLQHRNDKPQNLSKDEGKRIIKGSPTKLEKDKAGEILQTVIKDTAHLVTSEDVLTMAKGVIEKQKETEIDKHRRETAEQEGISLD